MQSRKYLAVFHLTVHTNSCSHTVVVFVYNPVSYISRDRPKSDTLAILCFPKRTFLAAKSRWTICQNMKNSKAHLLERNKNLR